MFLRKWPLATALLLGLISVHSLGAAGPEDLPAEHSLADQGFGEQTLRGGSPSLDFYFPGPGPLRIGDNNVFVLAMSHAEIVDPAVSTISIVMNGVPIHTRMLTPAEA